MQHKHDFETVYRPSLTPEAGAFGIRAAELRKCKVCGKEIPFIRIREEWVPLFEDKEADEQDILLA